MQITRQVEFDAGHRIPHHGSKCRNAHGHRYTIEATLRGPVKPADGSPDEGMVIDFSDIKAALMRLIHDPWDHSFIVWAGDAPMLDALLLLGDNHKTVVVPCVPTVENLVQLAFDVLNAEFDRIYGKELTLVRVRLFETPTCWADAVAPNVTGEGK